MSGLPAELLVSPRARHCPVPVAYRLVRAMQAHFPTEILNEIKISSPVAGYSPAPSSSLGKGEKVVDSRLKLQGLFYFILDGIIWSSVYCPELEAPIPAVLRESTKKIDKLNTHNLTYTEARE